ncbi:ribosomal protein L6, alpha-beta domain-containing protein [Pholiota molesta]|nr:ribosomal protein L6, alpha-beta domain-containing protein [Pholiota molesta]
MLPRQPIVHLARRSFSTTAPALKNVSIIGREPIKFPPSVTITPTPTEIDFPVEHTMKLSVAKSSEKLQRQMWGTTRTLIWNAIIGMTEGYTLEDDPRGTTDGSNGQRLHLRLGHSHSIFLPVPSHIKAEVPSATKIVLFCKDKHLLGLFAAKIREFRKPEPYKGKGVFIGNETIRIKSVKKK